MATFEISAGDGPEGVYLIPTVDVVDTEEVVEVVGERLLQMQIEEGIPVYVFPIRPVERVIAETERSRVSEMCCCKTQNRRTRVYDDS